MIPVLRQLHVDDMELGLVTCYAGTPEGFDGRVYHVSDYQGPDGRQRLCEELSQRGYAVCGIVCSGESIMTKWKWMLAARLRSKVLIINENADCFWFDRGSWRNMLQLVLHRAGMTGASAVPALARIVFFPFTLLFLLAYAATVHLQRRIRML